MSSADFDCPVNPCAVVWRREDQKHPRSNDMIALPHSIREDAHCGYLAGERVTAIAGKLGVKRVTVSQWAKRGDWASERKTVVERRMISVLDTVEAVTARNILVHQEQVQEVATALLALIADFPGKKPRELLALAKALAVVSKVARSNLGLPEL